MKHVRNFAAACLFAAWIVPGAAAAADAAPLATGIVSSGVAEAQVTEALRHGEILTIKVRFKGLKDNLNGQALYSSLDKDALEKSFYILVGNKKYLLLTDSNNVPLASPSVPYRSSQGVPYVATWFGSFPAPPADVKEVYLTLEGVEPLGPIAITDR
ncbi:hypothetical protein V2T44_17950 [Serratia ficaria]|jgi:hypothetical protein|uniref:Uncharacterized protein n=1 Tax=Serratia ficaria TaxID=61651 RepID=A0A240CAD6_SERFI|nr:MULTISPECIES: hypothetical protein [Serratia]MEE4484821.1 hypothetical protein [Serratia ficaria]REF43263.1 hypothetical protein C7332_1506 [Serratia ficaria]CAI0703696.1 Uncharacterised protein [Serratia ficaria]CAI1059657.1 Uncharacterised protein [Serratia ficaria]CAI1089407.1 Uncharacterised protein [Serratia ficaria]